MIPLPLILAELIMGVGAALVLGNAYALMRPRRGVVEKNQEVRVQAKGKVVISMFIGLLVFVWALASFITESGT